MPGRVPDTWYPKRGEVYLVDLDKPRPAAILSVDSLNKFALDVCLVPFTTVQHVRFSMRVPIKAGDGGLDYNCWAKCDQVSTLEKVFLHYPPLGMLSEASFRKIQEQVRIALGFSERGCNTVDRLGRLGATIRFSPPHRRKSAFPWISE